MLQRRITKSGIDNKPTLAKDETLYQMTVFRSREFKHHYRSLRSCTELLDRPVMTQEQELETTKQRTY
jgi:hypothetical protein